MPALMHPKQGVFMNQFNRRFGLIAGASVVGLAVSACGSGTASDVGEVNTKPAYIGEVSSSKYDGSRDDLLSAGLGKSGLASAIAPTVLEASAPTAAELRRLAIYHNYRALIDTSSDGGFGRLYGPNIDINGGDTLGEGKIAGTEYMAYADSGNGLENVSMMVQVPANFDPNHACIVTGTSSGSRGVYGAIATSGEWGLKHGCAVAYTDKGTGNGIHDLQLDTVTLQNGVRATAAAAGKNAQFVANLSASERAAFNAATPNRFAFKHAHSQQNPEKDWGKYTLQSIEFALYVLNQQFGELSKDGKSHLIRLTARNTLVMASSVSNGAGAALAAAEQDANGLIDGVAVSEPAQQLLSDNRISVTRGRNTLPGSGKSLVDYITLANLMQPCAALANNVANAPLRTSIVSAPAVARCNALRAKGLIVGDNLNELATNAQSILEVAGYQPESRELHAAMYAFATPAIATTYTNALGRFGVQDNLCGYSFSGSTTLVPQAFGRGNGIPPTIGINIYNNLSVGGAALDGVSISPSTGAADYNIDGALCQRDLVTGASANALRVQQGMKEVTRTANLRGKPAIIVHGRADTLIPVAFTSRPYFGLNRLVEGSSSKLAYIEVTNGQHFDSFLSLAGFDTRYIPLHVYHIQAMDRMYALLRSGGTLPPSQLVRTTARGADANGKALPLSASNVPAISNTPASADQITFVNNIVNVPD
jgi:hydroxybutyrate-dimer hydrolase